MPIGKYKKTMVSNRLQEPWDSMYQSLYKRLLAEYSPKKNPAMGGYSLLRDLLLERVVWNYAVMKQAEAEAGPENLVELQNDKNYRECYKTIIRSAEQVMKYTETKKSETKKIVETHDYSELSDERLEQLLIAAFGQQKQIIIEPSPEIN